MASTVTKSEMQPQAVALTTTPTQQLCCSRKMRGKKNIYTLVCFYSSLVYLFTLPLISAYLSDLDLRAAHFVNIMCKRAEDEVGRQHLKNDTKEIGTSDCFRSWGGILWQPESGSLPDRCFWIRSMSQTGVCFLVAKECCPNWRLGGTWKKYDSKMWTAWRFILLRNITHVLLKVYSLS